MTTLVHSCDLNPDEVTNRFGACSSTKDANEPRVSKMSPLNSSSSIVMSNSSSMAVTSSSTASESSSGSPPNNGVDASIEDARSSIPKVVTSTDLRSSRIEALLIMVTFLCINS